MDASRFRHAFLHELCRAHRRSCSRVPGRDRAARFKLIWPTVPRNAGYILPASLLSRDFGTR